MGTLGPLHVALHSVDGCCPADTSTATLHHSGTSPHVETHATTVHGAHCLLCYLSAHLRILPTPAIQPAPPRPVVSPPVLVASAHSCASPAILLRAPRAPPAA